MDTPALDSIPIAIFAHDLACDLAQTLAYLDNDVEIDVSDPREVAKLLDGNFSLTMRVMEELNSEPFHEIHDSVMQLPEIPSSEPWENAERILSKFINDRIAKAIISAVDRLATLIKAEKISALLKSKSLPKTLGEPDPVQTKSEPGRSSKSNPSI